MKYKWEINNDGLHVAYQWKVKGKWQSLSVVADRELSEIPKDSETAFITEHYWGYSRYNKSVTNEYEVRHPYWDQYAVKSHDISVDFGLTYGDAFRFLNSQNPISVFLAEGSKISIEAKKVIRL